MVPVMFGAKKFAVSAKKIYTPDGIKISEALATEEVEVSGKKPTLNIKGVGLQNISMTVKLDSRFVDVRYEISLWKSYLLGKHPRMLTIGQYQVGQMYLTSYEVSDLIIDKDGKYTKATLDLSFIEDGANANVQTINFNVPQKVTTVKKSATSTGTSTSASKTPVAYGGTTSNKSQTSNVNKSTTIKKGSTIKPKDGVRWYYTAEDALKKTGKSGKAYQKNMTVTYTYSKSGKIVCVNPGGLGWMRIQDVILIK